MALVMLDVGEMTSVTTMLGLLAGESARRVRRAQGSADRADDLRAGRDVTVLESAGRVVLCHFLPDLVNRTVILS